MTLAFDNIAISVTDVDAAAQWYGDMFDFKPGYRTHLGDLDADFLVLEREDVRVELVSQAGCQQHEDGAIQTPNHLKKSKIIAMVFRTNDIEAATKDFEAKGAIFVWKNQLLSEDGLRSTMLRDPDQNMINVLCYPNHAPDP